MSALIHDVMSEVWMGLTGYAKLELVPDPTRVVAYRAQGDLYRFASEPVLGLTLAAVDSAVVGALEALKPLTVSEALEAGERRRCVAP